MNGIIAFLLETSFNLFLAGNNVVHIILKRQDTGSATLVENVCVRVRAYLGYRGNVVREKSPKNTERVYFWICFGVLGSLALHRQAASGSC